MKADKELTRAISEVPGTLQDASREGFGRSYFGVSGIDELIPQGVSHNTQIMCTGDTGVGKTVFAAQFLHEGLLVGDFCLYVACDEPPSAMRANMAAFNLGSIGYEQAGRLVFLDAYARERSTERWSVPNPTDLDEYFAYERNAVERFGDRPFRLVVDSLSTLFGTAERAAVLEFNRNRLRYLFSRRALVLDNFVNGLLDEQTIAGLSHSYPFMLRLGYQSTGAGDVQRFLQLGKLRSGVFSGERRQFRIDPRVGPVVQR